MINAYDHAAAFVFPSLYEGFGLPVLEAMTRGAPVVASQSSSLPEVVGDGGYLFKPGDPEDLARQLAALLCDGGVREVASKHALEQAATFSWSKVGRMALEAVGDLVAAKARPRRRREMIDVEETVRRCAKPMIKAGLEDQATEIVDRVLFSGRPGQELGAPRLLVDVTVTAIEDHKTGIQRVVRETTRALQKIDDLREAEPVVFSNLTPILQRRSAARAVTSASAPRTCY